MDGKVCQTLAKDARFLIGHGNGDAIGKIKSGRKAAWCGWRRGLHERGPFKRANVLEISRVMLVARKYYLRLGRVSSHHNPLDLVLREPLLGAVIKLRRTRAFVRRHRLGMLQRAAIGEIRRDAGRPE